MIYCLQPVDGGPIKIGFTDDLTTRHKALEVQYGCKLVLLFTMPGGRPEEAEIHEKFKAARLGRTEQFKPVAELMAFIGMPLLVGANPDAVEAMGLAIERVAIIHLKGSRGYSAWLDEMHRETHIGKATLVRVALAEWAARNGKRPPPEI